jgi:hypothetical protein
MSTARYAVYYTPPLDHPLTQTAGEWLTGEPRRYGFHATLKAPFRLNENCAPQDLEKAIGMIARTCSPCRIGPLKISLMQDFFALVPVDSGQALLNTAARVVQALDRFRAPMNDSEMQRRLRGRLDDVERAHLSDWGYPYVLDRYRFHMTLTGSLTSDQQPAMQQRLEKLFVPFLAESYQLDALTLFVQPAAQENFQIRSQFALGV